MISPLYRVLLTGLIGIPVCIAAQPQPDPPPVIQELNRSMMDDEKNSKTAPEKFAAKLRGRGFVEGQLLEGAAYIARSKDIFAPGPHTYAFHGINYTLWPIWKQKLGTDEGVIKDKVLPIVRDPTVPPRMRLFYLQLADSHLRDLNNQKKQVPATLARLTADTAHAIGTDADPSLSAYSIRVVAAWGSGREREEYLTHAFSSQNPSLQDAAAEAATFWGASEENQDKVLALCDNIQSLSSERWRNILRATSRLASDKRAPSARRQQALDKLIKAYEQSTSPKMREGVGNVLLRVASDLPNDERDGVVKKIKLLHDRSTGDAKNRLGRTLSDLSVVEENEQRKTKRH